ncbi:hypothetical protein [Brevundimonas basaltis]|uniref:hypothetical protein n=1 Tax=Brevundimonas basaltis TaxID=472166 RepID=UPI00160634A1|nr:hypothetical protein [Brevundimonas basaltis]
MTVPEVVGGAPFDLPPDVADQTGIRYVRVLTAPGVFLRYAERTDADHRVGVVDDARKTSLESDIESEIRNELRYCATGEQLLDATIYVDQLSYDNRAGSLADGSGVDEMSAVVEFVELVEPDGAGRSVPPVVGRYRISVGARTGNLVERLLGDSISHAAEELGRALCMEAFGRNPRPPGLQNSTR